MNNSIRGKRMFVDLPSPKLLSTSKGSEKFKEKIEQIYKEEEEKELKEIANILYTKLITKDPNNSWTVTEYKEFRKIFFNIEIKRVNIIGSSIKKCLETSNSEMFEELNSFSQQNEWYPEKERIKDEKTNKYIYKTKEIKLSDCFLIINNLVSYMYRYIRQYAGRITKEFDSKEDITSIINQVQEDFLSNFDINFKFIESYPLFKDVYIKVRRDSLKILTQEIYSINSVVNKREMKYTQWGANLEARKHTAPLRNFSKAYTKK